MTIGEQRLLTLPYSEVTIGEERLLTLPYSEVNMFMGIAGDVVAARLVGPHAVELLDDDGRPFCGRITTGEAGWGLVGFDHTLTDFDATTGHWLPKTHTDTESRSAA